MTHTRESSAVNNQRVQSSFETKGKQTSLSQSEIGLPNDKWISVSNLRWTNTDTQPSKGEKGNNLFFQQETSS